jgi:hypothetical protein
VTFPAYALYSLTSITAINYYSKTIISVGALVTIYSKKKTGSMELGV